MPYKPTGRPAGRPRRGEWANEWRRKPTLSPRQWKAVQVEVEWLDWDVVLSSQERLNDISKFPSTLSAGQISVRIHVSRQLVNRWRRSAPYSQGIIWALARAFSKRRAKARRSRRITYQSPPSRFAETLDAVKANWPEAGGVRSPLTDKVFDDPGEYAAHISENGMRLAPGKLAK